MHHAIKHIARLRLLREFCARFAFSCALAALLAAPAAQAELPVPPAAFDKGSLATVSGYAGTTPLAGFPVLVRLAEGSPAGFSYAQLHSPADGADLLFTDADGAPIPFEIDTWDADGTSLVWVTPPVTTNGAQFAMFWGSDTPGKTICPDNPWSDYTGVWHMNETGTPSSSNPVTIHDSTANGLDGSTPVGKAADESVIGGAWRIAEDNNHDRAIRVPVGGSGADPAKKAAADALGTDFHASFWVRAMGVVQWANLICRRKGDEGTGWGFSFHENSGSTPELMRVYAGSTTPATTSGTYNLGAKLCATDDVWKKVDVVWKCTANNNVQIADIYLNGAYLETVTCKETVNQQDTDIGIGCSTQDAYDSNDKSKKGRRFNGEMDEVRLGAFVPSPDWIAADYATQTSASFLTMAPAENARLPVEPVFSSVAFASAAETTASFSVAVRRIGEGAASAALSAVVCVAGAAAAATNAVETLTTAGTFSETLTGLAPATAYEVFFRLENEVDGVAYATESETLSFETVAIDENPTVSLSLSRVYVAAADLEVSVPRFGYGASSLSSLSLSYGTDPADESGWTTVALAPPAAEGGTVAHRLVGLRTGATYYAKVVAENDLAAPGSFTTPVLSFTPAGSGSASYAVSTTGSAVTTTGLDDGTTVVHFLANGTFTLDEGASARLLLVGGGGAGGSTRGGGGGAGGFLEIPDVHLEAGTYTVTVGAGGAPATAENTQGGDGGETSLSFGGATLYAAPGGGGGGSSNKSGNIRTAGRAGGSGGGGAPAQGGGAATAVSPALGNAGGGGGTGNNAANGGGGAGGPGATGYSSDISSGANRRQGGAGGAGVASDITGETLYYAGGGGGSCWFDENGGYKGLGGSGVGGDGAGYTTEVNQGAVDATSGRDGTGSGGGGAGINRAGTASDVSGAGGGGTLIVRLAATGADDSVPQLADYRVSGGVNTVSVSATVRGLGFGGASASVRYRVAETEEGLASASWTAGETGLAAGDPISFGAGELTGWETGWVETEIRNDLGVAWSHKGHAEIVPPVFEPSLSLAMSGLSSTSAVVTVVVDDFGYGATALSSLTLAYGVDGTEESGWTTLALDPPAAAGGRVTAALSGLAAGTAYRAKATAVNDLSPAGSASALIGFSPFDPATFLERLASLPTRVAASPHATGGDVILRIGDAEYVHVFTNAAAAATFTAASDLRAWVLVVAGGGAAGSVTQSPGGGGAGGMVEESGVALAADTPYTATVGAGGAATTGQNGNKNGGNSSFAGGAVSLTAIGGGRGSDHGANMAGSGGSGGGAGSGGTVTSGGAGTAGQGYEGGGVLAAPYNVGGGGGGGAGAPGGTVMIYASESPLGAIHGGLGGDGLSSDILGFEQYFAGGGGGYYNKTAANGCIRSPGGLGGGGSGGISGDTAGENGEDGLGGGGGGGLAKAASGRGGSGIVVVRYVVWTDSAPLLRASTATAKGGSFATVAGSLAAYGAGETSATVKMRFWKTSAPAETAVATVLELEGNDALDAAFEKTVGGFEPETEYRYALYAEGANGSSAEQTGSFTTFSTSIGTATSGGTASVVGVDRVHIFTESGTFTATGSGYAEILVVGGGGAGGYGWQQGPGGGGGGGGVVHVARAYLEPGTYAVTVGAGGTMNGSTVADIVSAGDSSFALSSGPAGFSFDAITAYGGGNGIGWIANNAAESIAKANGASGGGGARNVNGSQATAVFGQGHRGGDCGYDYRPGGGGGAGAKGENGTASGVTPSGAGAGGAGLAFSITGTRVVYGSGGGGGARSNADVMAPGGENGGNGEYGTVAATSGVDGTGGGGGGGGGGSEAAKQGGAGGSGTVIVRYTDFALAGDSPVLAVHDDDATIGCNSILLPVEVPSAGAGASTVTLVATWRHSGEASDLGSLTLPDFIGDAVLDIPADPGRAYAVTVSIDNGQAGGTAEWTGTFESAPMFSETLAYTATGGTLSYVVDGAATADSQRLELWVGPDASSMTNQATYTDASLLAAGAHTIQPFAANQFGESVAILLRHVAVVGARAFTNDTAVLSATIQDGATYTWKSDVAEGDWCDAANWTASAAGGRGWPTAGSTAKFPNMTSTVRIDRAVSFSTAKFDNGGTWSFAGTTSGASLSFGGSGDAILADGSYRFDALAVRVSAGQNGWLGNNQRIVLENGAALVSSKNLCLQKAGGSLLIGAGCSFAGNGLGGSKGASLVVSNGTATVSGVVNLSERGSAADLPASLSICGADARISCNGFYSHYTNATVTVELEGTYSQAEALIRGTGTTAMAASGGTLTFEAPQTRGSKRLGKCDILVADWSKKSINTELVEFGEVDREGSYFYFTETADPKGTQYKSAEEVADAGATVKCLWYHHAPPSGMAIIVR